MAALDNTQALINDALFRCGEIPGASEWDTKAVDYINREHRAVCSGASEFLPEYIHDWWWMRESGILTILPVISLGTVAVTQDSTGITFSSPPTISVQGRRFKVNTEPDIYIISAHIAGQPNATLDSPYTGPTKTTASFTAMQTIYQLSASVDSLLSPIHSFRENPSIMGLSPERMDELFPPSRVGSGIPQAFCLENEKTIRFNTAGRTDGTSMRMEYRYRPAVVDLINTSSSFPLIPLQWRHVLSDMISVYIMFDKNDDRATAVGTSARSTLGAMAKENLRRGLKMDRNVARIMPRMGGLNRNPLRTASGLIISRY